MKDDRLYLVHMLERCRGSNGLRRAARQLSEYRRSRGSASATRLEADCGIRDVLIQDYIGVDLEQGLDSGIDAYSGVAASIGATFN